LNAVGSEVAAAVAVVAVPMVAVPGAPTCPPVAVKVVVPPIQATAGTLLTVTAVGVGFTVIATVFVAVHPSALVPVTVYVLVDVGLAVTVSPVAADKPVAGDQA
jgi:hypothetical protein